MILGKVDGFLMECYLTIHNSSSMSYSGTFLKFKFNDCRKQAQARAKTEPCRNVSDHPVLTETNMYLCAVVYSVGKHFNQTNNHNFGFTI